MYIYIRIHIHTRHVITLYVIITLCLTYSCYDEVDRFSYRNTLPNTCHTNVALLACFQKALRKGSLQKKIACLHHMCLHYTPIHCLHLHCLLTLCLSIIHMLALGRYTLLALTLPAYICMLIFALLALGIIAV